jgi:uncharacterized membrane protein
MVRGLSRLILNALASLIGISFLWIKFRGKKSIKDLRKEAEDESFAIQGVLVILFIVGIIMLVATLTFLFVVIYRIIIDL